MLRRRVRAVDGCSIHRRARNDRYERLRPALVAELADAETRVLIARRFHNEAVAQAQRMRAKRGVRVLHLAGRAPMPQMVEFDDVWPAELPRPGRGVVAAGR